MYEELVAALKALKNVSFAEHEWATRPTTDFGTVQLDFDAAQDEGDDLHTDRAIQGSVDLYTHGQAWTTAAAVENVLEEICGASWHLNLKAYESSTGLIHREFVFEIEVL